MPGRTPDARDRLWYTLLAIWLTGMIAGGVWLWGYKLTPAAVSAGAPGQWPADSPIALAADRATLVMLAHPKCPCTRASVAELDRLLSDTRDRVHAHVFVVRPPDAPEGWEHTDLWDRIQAIPGVSVHVDGDGAAARRLGAVVSGHVVVYDAAGRLLYQGGITGARGHEGDNPGRSQAAAAILQGTGDGRSPTFGCELLGADEIAKVSSGEQPGH